jgi:hypothetical protein
MSKRKRLSMAFNEDIVKFVDDWRREQTPIPSFNQAVNTIIHDYELIMIMTREAKKRNMALIEQAVKSLKEGKTE